MIIVASVCNLASIKLRCNQALHRMQAPKAMMSTTIHTAYIADKHGHYVHGESTINSNKLCNSDDKCQTVAVYQMSALTL